MIKIKCNKTMKVTLFQNKLTKILLKMSHLKKFKVLKILLRLKKSKKYFKKILLNHLSNYKEALANNYLPKAKYQHTNQTEDFIK